MESDKMESGKMKPSNIRMVYMGTPDFAVPALTALAEQGYKILSVVTQPDKARDRGKQVQFTAVKAKALELEVPVLQPEKIKGNQEFIKAMQDLHPDLIIVAAYGKLLPPELLEIPRYGCINIHGSLLPKYRGAAPIQRSIQNGDVYTGITLMYMAQELDAGDMLVNDKTTTAGKSAADLHDELSQMGASLLIDALPRILDGSIVPVSQDPSEATYAAMIKKEDGHLDFRKKPEELERQIRAMDPWPGAFAYYQGVQFKIREASVSEQKNDKPPGTINESSVQGLSISAGGGILVIKKLQFPGKKSMLVSEFLKGNRIEIGEILL